MPYGSDLLSRFDPRQILALAGRAGQPGFQPQDQRVDPYSRALGLDPSQPTPASFRDLPQDYRRQAQGTALAALGAEIGAAPTGRLGEGIARGAYAYGKERAGALESFTKAAMEQERQKANISYQQALERQMAEATLLRQKELEEKQALAREAAVKAAETEKRRVDGLNAFAEMIPSMHPSLQGPAVAAFKAGDIQEAQQIAFKNSALAQDAEEKEREMAPFRNYMATAVNSGIPKEIRELAQVRADSGDPRGAASMLASAVSRQQSIKELAPRFEEEMGEGGLVRTVALDKRTGAVLWTGGWTEDKEVARFQRRLGEKILAATAPRLDTMGLVEDPDAPGGFTIGSNIADVAKAYDPKAVAAAMEQAKKAVDEAIRGAAIPKPPPPTPGGTPDVPEPGGVPQPIQVKMLRELEPKAKNLFDVPFGSEEDDPLDADVVSAWLKEIGGYGDLMKKPGWSATVASLVEQLRKQRAASRR